MVNGGDILHFLCPDAQWVVYGIDYDSINWFGKEPAITKAQFEAGFTTYDVWKTEQETKAEADKASAQAKLTALGLTADDLKALGL